MDNPKKAEALSLPMPSGDTSRKKAFEKVQEELEKEMGFWFGYSGADDCFMPGTCNPEFKCLL